MTEREKMIKGYLWHDDGENLGDQLKAKELLYDFNHSRPAEEEKRTEILKQLLGSMGDPLWVMQPLTLCIGKTVSIGKYTYINSNLVLVDDHEITIGDGCLFGPNVTISTTGHPIDPDLRATGRMYSYPVHIGNNCWIGSGAVILPGVTIGDNTVIGAGSIVTKDIPANVVAVGNPCRVLREVNERDKEYYYHDRKVSDMEE